MAHGLLRCIGSNLHLKNKFGEGFKVTVTYDEGRNNKGDVIAFLLTVLPRAKLLHDFAGSLSYQVHRNDLVVSSVFAAMEARPPQLGIHDWGLQQTSLEEVSCGTKGVWVYCCVFGAHTARYAEDQVFLQIARASEQEDGK